MMAIFYKTILRLNYLKSLNKIELPVQLPPEAPPTFGIGCGGRRGRPCPKNRQFPAGPKTMY